MIVKVRKSSTINKIASLTLDIETGFATLTT